MIERQMEGIYKIEVPLTGNPLKALNAWLLTGSEGNLLIDTGFNRDECFAAVQDAFAEIDADPSRTDLFITHLHADHSGLIPRLLSPEKKVYCSGPDGALINRFSDPAYWDGLDAIFQRHGMPSREADVDHTKHPGQLYGGMKQIPFTTIEEGDVLEAGRYRLRCISTPGHTPGHMCLYEEEHRLLFSGDHILSVITPNITIEESMMNPLSQYLKSLEKIRDLDVRRVFTGHRAETASLQDRIRELQQHHEVRLAEVMRILRERGTPLSAYEIAEQMTWHVRYRTWQELPRQQRWFATGEAMAHMLYLEEQGLLKRQTTEDRIRFIPA